jgi:hypothetical protein
MEYWYFLLTFYVCKSQAVTNAQELSTYILRYVRRHYPYAKAFRWWKIASTCKSWGT